MVKRILRFWLFLQPFLARGLNLFFPNASTRMYGVGESVRNTWRRFSHFQQNLVIGVLTAIGLQLAHDMSWVRDTEDWAMDWMNQMQVDTPMLAGGPRHGNATGYAFLDMDQAAYDAWDEPYHVPRDRLLQLIRYAVSSGAKTVIVDVDLSRPGVDPAAAKALQDYVAGYPADGPPLIFMRTFTDPPAGRDVLPTIRRTYFDAAATSPAIHWAQPRFDVDSRDRAVRRWRLVDLGCLDGAPVWLPSPQFAAALLADPGAPGWPQVARRLAAQTPAGCNFAQPPDLSGAGRLQLGGRELDLFAGGARQRVVYGFSARLPLGAESLGYRRLPATLITASDTPPASDPVAGRVVIIGASYQTSHDVHATPVGTMPGSLIILNAVKSLQQFGQLKGPPLWARLLISGLLIALMAWAFARFSSFSAMWVIGGGVVLLLVPVAFYVFRHGVWVDMAFPILGMQVHRLWRTASKPRDRHPDLVPPPAEHRPGSESGC